MSARVFTDANLVDSDGIRRGWVMTVAGEITAVGEGEYQGSGESVSIISLGGDYLAPGFIDLHSHGGGGGSYANSAEIETTLNFHEAHGTSFSYLSLVSDSPENLRKQAAAIRTLQKQDPRILGVHFEGPMISPAKSGAHSPHWLLSPKDFGIEATIELLSYADYVTIAPELPGALEVIRELSARGVRVAIGHTNCDYETAILAFEAGAVAVTHLFNAMNPIHHRSPGPVLAARDYEGVIVELITDGHHLHESVVTAAFELFPQRIAVVTDAISAAGAPSGDYFLGDLEVVVDAETATLKNTATLAGSLLTLDSAFSKIISYGVPFADAVTAFSSTPAKIAPNGVRIGKLEKGNNSKLLRIEEDLKLMTIN